MMPRFFVSPERITQADSRHVVIEGDDAHHIARVLRLRPGNHVVVADGAGLEYPGTIDTVDRTAVRIHLDEPRISQGEPTQRITLFQGLPKSDKMDWVVQKAAEIGVTTVVPVTMERSVVSLSPAKAAGRVARWERIAESAAQQAARGRVPRIDEPVTLQAALRTWQETTTDGLLIVPWEEEEAVGLRSLLQKVRPVPAEIGIVIGPEGGLTEAEIALVRSAGGRACTLGPRILRTETAGPVVAALILYDLGEMGG